MSNLFSPYLRSLAGVSGNPLEQKREEVAQTTTAKKSRLEQGLLDGAISAMSGAGAQTTDYNEFYSQFVPAHERIRNNANARRGVLQDALAFNAARNARTLSRSNTEAIGDAVEGAVMGANSALGSLGALVLDQFDANLGTQLARNVQYANEQSQAQRSPALRISQQLVEAQNRLSKRDTTAQYNQDIQDGDHPYWAEAKRIGRDAGNAVSNLVDNPIALSDGVASAAGSMATIAPISRLLGMFGATAKATAPTAIGLVEAGGAYGGAVNEAMGNEDPSKNVDVKTASRAGNTAALVQGPIAALASRMIPHVAQFEHSPLGAKSVRAALANVGAETVEEISQSATGQIAQNIGIQRQVDPNKSLTEGVGRAVGEGGLFGMLSAGAMQAPAVARQPVKAVAAGMGAIAGAASRLRKSNEASSPVSTENVNTAVNDAMANSEEARTQAVDAMAQSDMSPEAQAEVTSYLDQLSEALQFNKESLVSEGYHPEIVEKLADSNNTAELLTSLSEYVKDTSNSETSRQAAATTLSQINNYVQQVIEDMPESARNTEIDPSIVELIQGYAATLGSMSQTPEVSQGIKDAETTIADAVVQPVDEAGLNTPEGELQTTLAVAQAEIAPEKANLEAVQQVLKHADSGLVQLTDRQRQALGAVASLLSAAQEYDAQAQRAGLRTQDVVGKEIKSGDSGSTGKSALQHVKDIRDALRMGETGTAVDLARRFSEFAKHMQGKVEALNQSVQDGLAHGYNAYNSKKDAWFPSKKELILHPNNNRSLDLARQIEAEATFVGNVVNNLASTFPELGIEPVTISALDTVKATPTATKAPVQPVVKPEPVKKETKPVEDVNKRLQEAAQQDAEESADTTVPETKVEPVKTEKEEADTKPVVNLVPASKFTQVYKQPDVAKSRVATLDKPIATVDKALLNQDNLEDFTGAPLRKTFTQEHSDAIRSYMRRVMPQLMGVLNKNLTSFLDQVYTKGGKETMRDRLIAGGLVTEIKRGQATSITETDGKDVRYNRALIESAVLAAAHWRLNANKMNPRMDDVDIASILGIDISQINEGIRESFHNTQGLDQIKRSLSATIQQFWGVDKVPNAPIGQTQGIPDAVAAELIRAMTETGDLTRQTIKFGDKDMFRYEIISPEEAGDLAGFTDVLAVASIPDFVPTTYIGTGTKVPVAKTVLRNPLVKLTPQQRKAISNEQATEFTVNPVSVNFYKALDKDGMIQLFSQEVTDDMNVNHRQSVEGLNLSITGSYDALMDTIAEVQGTADVQGTSLTDTPIRYAYEITSVGRMHMQGPYNPQASKYTRESILPTWSTLDLSSQNGDGYRAFMLAIAQAAGIKVNGQSLEKSVEDVAAKLDSMTDTVKLMQEWVSDNESKSVNEVITMDRAFIETIKREAKAANYDITPMSIHALQEYARYLNASDKSAFRTGLYLEADGVTNGPFNAMMLMTSGRFTPEWIENVARGGLTFMPNMSLNQYRSTVDGVDLYKKSAIELQNEMSSLLQYHKGTDVGENIAALLNLMSTFSKDINYDDASGDITVERGLSKNPLTITVYGSGSKGIAGKMVSGIVTEIYKRLSDVAAMQRDYPDYSVRDLMFARESVSMEDSRAKYDAFMKSLNLLTSSHIIVDSESMGVGYSSFKVNMNDPSKFTFSQNELAGLESNMEHLFVSQMQEAIKNTIGENVMENVKLIQQATQIQSLVLKEMFNNGIKRKIAERRAAGTWKATDFLTDADIADVHASLEKYAPIVDNGAQNFYISGREANDVTITDFGRALDDTLPTPPRLYGPSDAGVRAIPTMVIGSGDGMMMQILSATHNPANTLKIFDGMNMPLDRITEYSVMANEAVRSSIKTNPMESIQKSYAQFLENVDLSQLSKETVNEIKRTLGIYKTASSAQINNAMKGISTLLSNRAESAKQRAEVIASVTSSMDQMASAAAPSVTEGVTINSTDPADIAAVLNARMDSGSVANNGSLRVTVESLKESFKDNELFNTIADIVGDKVTIVLGSKDSVRAQAILDGVPFDGTTNGVFVPATNTVYAIQGSNEVILHELIHAATINNLNDFYTNGTGTPQVAAVRSAEALMNQFLNMDGVSLPVSVQIAMESAQAAIKNGLNQGTALGKAEALSEFMAWGLSNQDLAKTLKGTKANRLSNLATRVIGMIRNFIFGSKKHTFSADMLSRLRFNTEVVMNIQPSVSETLNNTLQHNSTYGTDSRINEIVSRLADRLSLYKKQPTNPLDKIERNSAAERAMMLAKDTVAALQFNGFPLDMQRASAFEMIVQSMAVDMKHNPDTMIRVQELYAHVMKNLDSSSFLSDKNTDDPNQLAQADLRMRALSGEFTRETDESGRSTLLPAFIGLALVDDSFRQVLSKLPVPKENLNEWNTLDNVVDNIGKSMMDNLGTILAGDSIKNKDLASSIDSLMNRLTDIAQDRQSFLQQTSSQFYSAIDQANDYVVRAMDNLGSKVETVGEALTAKAKNPYSTTVGKIIRSIGVMAQRDNSAHLGEMLSTTMSKVEGMHPLREFLSDLVGRTQSNGTVYDMIKSVRSVVQQARQTFRENVPSIIASKFKGKLSAEEWSSLHTSLGKADVAALLTTRTTKDVASLLKTDKALNGEITRLEASLKKEVGKDWAAMKVKAQEVATYMMTGQAAPFQLRNAYAVALMLGSSKQNSTQVADALHARLDDLISLYAVNQLTESDKTTLRDKLDTEAEGMDYAMSYLSGQRKEEAHKANQNQVAKLNGYKGYIPTIGQQGVSLMIADDTQHAKLVGMSYVRVGEYLGSGVESGKAHKGYYFAKVNGRSPYNQGIQQNIRDTSNGVDTNTGFSSNTMTAGRITKPGLIARYLPRMSQHNTGNEVLMPVFNESGNVVALERTASPEMLSRLNQEKHLAKALGVWRGRQVEEMFASEFNNQLLDALNDMYVKGKNLDQSAFIDILSPKEQAKDPVLADVVKLFDQGTLERMGEYNDGKFYVRRDMLNDAFGYRVASIGDMWTGDSRWSPKTQKMVSDMAMVVFGNDAYRMLTNSERILKNVVADAKTIIVVKSVVVPAVNMISNIMQLIARGVPVGDLVKGIGSKTNEIAFYHKSRIRQTEIEADMRAFSDNPAKLNPLKTELQSILDSYKRLSIWPLIEAGEFTSIADASVSREDVPLTEGKLTSYIEGLVDKLPESVRNAGRYAVITKDTALFRGLQRSVDYGDFISKAIIYDHLTKRKGKTSAEALAQVTDEFVNYDKASGRTRQYLESVGLLWFYNFKIRASKVALSMIRHNPVQTMIASVLPAPTIFGNAGMPTDDSLVAKLGDGTLSYSLGFGQGLRSPTLNPWYALTQ